MKTIKYFTIISLLSVFSLTGLVSNNEAVTNQMSGPVIIDQGTPFEYTVGEDNTTIHEPGDKVPSGYVQSPNYLPSFDKVVFEGLSHYTGTYIQGVSARDDGDFTVLMSASNVSSYEQSQVVDSSDPVPRDYYIYLLVVGIDGVVKKSVNITDSTQTIYDGTGAFKNTLDSDDYYAAGAHLYDDGSNYLVAYQGRRFNDLDGDFKYNNVFKIDYNFSTSSTYLVNASDTSYEDAGNGLEAKHTEFIVPYFNYVADEGYQIVDTVAISERSWGEDAKKFQLSSVQLTNITTNQTLTSQVNYQVPKWNEVIGVSTEHLSYALRRIGALYEIENSTDTFGIVSYSAIDLLGNRISKDILTIWDEHGNKKYSYDLGQNSFHRIQRDISTATEIYFLHNQFLKKINLQTGEITHNILELPSSHEVYSSINIEYANSQLYDSSFEVMYNFYGNITNANGIFSAYGKNGGTVVGAMREDFSIVNATIIDANPRVSMELLTTANGDIFTYGFSRGNQTFFNEPTATTNSIDGNGWIDKSSSDVTSRDDFDTYMGSSRIIDDYAPAIKFASVETINKDEITSDEQWNQLLTSGVQVYDTVDLDTNSLINQGLSESEMMDNLRSKINVNPNNMTLPIDWLSLGVDKENVGYYNVKYFVTDSSGQTSQTSGAVNIISNNTLASADGSLFIDATGFTVAISDVDSLSTSLVKSDGYANLRVWNTSFIDNSLVSVDQSQLAAIKNATTTGIYQLTFSYEVNGQTVSKTINVYVTSDIYEDEIHNDNVVVANNFTLPLSEAASYTSDTAILASDATAYRVYDGYIYDNSTLMANPSNVNNASSVGIYPVDIKFTDPAINNNGEHFKLTETVGAFVVDNNTVTNDNMLLSANSFIVDVDTVAQAIANGTVTSLIATNSNLVAQEFLPTTKEVVKYSVDDLTLTQAVKAVEGAYSVTYKFDSSQQLTKPITVYVVDSLTNRNHVIGASDTVITTSQANTFAALDYVNSTGAVALDKTSNSIVTGSKITTDYSKVAAAAGTYPLIFSYSEVLVNVNAYVFDSVINGNHTLGANNIFMSVAEVNAYNNSNYISASNATLFDVNKEIVTNASYSVNSSNVLAIPGTYNLYFTSKATTVGVSAYVYDVVDRNSSNIFAGNNMYLSSSEVATYLNDSSKLVELGNVISLNSRNNSFNNITKINTGSLSSAFGTYEIKYTDSKGNVLTLLLTVGNNLAVNNGIAIAGDNVMYSVDEIETFDGNRDDFNSDLISRSSARAWYIATNSDIGVAVNSSTVYIGTSDVEGFEPYTNQTFYKREGYISPKLKDLIQSDNTVVNEELGFVIAADPFGLNSTQISTLTSNDYIDLAGARAYDVNSDSLGKLDNLNVDYSNVKEQEGSYEVIYSLEQDGKTVVETSVTVYVGEGRTPEVIGSENIVIYASNYIISDDEVESFNEYDHISRANAYVIDLDTNEKQSNLFVDYSNIRDDSGTYAVYFGESKSLVSAVKVTVVANNQNNAIISIISYLLIMVMVIFATYRYLRRKRA